MDKNLQGKRILFIGPIFYNYHLLIKESLIELGGIVDFVPEKEYGIYSKILEVCSKSSEIARSNRKFIKEISKLKDIKYNYIFIIRGEYLNREIIEMLKAYFINAKLIAYHWDSFKYNPNGLIVSDLFDRVYSFDREDVLKRNNIEYKALFYTNKSIQSDEGKAPVRDILFVGVDYSDRYKLVKIIARESDKLRLRFDHYLITSKYSFYKKKILRFRDYRKAIKSEFAFEKIDYPAFINLMMESKAVLDINYEGQAGLTMRTIEVLALGKKLITTNDFIALEPFYDPASIYVLNRSNPVVDLDFINSDYKRLNMDEYYLKNWIKSFFINYEQ